MKDRLKEPECIKVLSIFEILNLVNVTMSSIPDGSGPDRKKNYSVINSENYGMEPRNRVLGHMTLNIIFKRSLT